MLASTENPAWRGLAALLLLAVLALGGHWLLFTHFMVYDDEGYVLWSLRSYAAEGGLYTHVYSQYGPLFYVAYDAVHRLTGLEFTNTTGRWITLGFWAATAWIGGSFAWRATRNVSASLAALALTFAALSVMSSEPAHPGGPLVFLSALGAWWGGRALLAGRPQRFIAVTAVIGAAMLAIKINVGVFFLIAAASWVALHTRLTVSRTRALEWLVLIGCLLSPWVLMGDRLGAKPGYGQFALVFTAGAVGVALLLRQSVRTADHRPRDWTVFAGWTVGTLGLIALAVIARGTAWTDLLHGMVLAPLNQPLSYSFPPRWEPAASVLAIVSLGFAAKIGPRSGLTPGWCTGLAIARLALLAGVAWGGWQAEDHIVGRYLFHFGTGVAWLYALPLRETPARDASLRLWLAWVAVWQTLHAFPVAGSQVAWGSLLMAPLVVIGALEAVQVLAGARVRVAGLGAVGILLVAMVPATELVRTGWIYRGVSTELGLPGAERLRLPINIANSLRAMTRNAVLHGDTLFSHPGMFSFNLWSGRPTPTAANVTVWSTLLSEAQQEAIRQRLAADPRAVVIAQEYVLNHLILQGFAPRGELNAYLIRNFTPAFRVETYVFWVQRGRSIAPVGTAKIGPEVADAGRSLDVVTDAHGTPARWEIWTNGYAHRVAAGTFAETTAQVQSLRPDGTTDGPARPLAEAALAGELVRLTWWIPPARLPGVDDIELRLFDANGRLVERVPFRR